MALTDQIEAVTSERRGSGLAWSGLKPFRIVGLRDESDVVRSFWLSHEDGETLPKFRAGQYIPIRSKEIGGGRPLIRTYSLSDAPGSNRTFRISIKREEGALNGILPAGVFSNHMHSSMTIGDELLVGAPRGKLYP